MRTYALAALLLAQPASAAPILWQNVEAGMSREALKALKVPKQVNLSEGCKAEVVIRTELKKVSAVELESPVYDVSERCASTVGATLFVKYGEPARTERQIVAGPCMGPPGKGIAGLADALCKANGGDLYGVEVTQTWHADGVEIQLTRKTGDERSWKLVYRPEVSTFDAGKL